MDDEPEKQREYIKGFTVSELKRAVLHDLVDLFNTKRIHSKSKFDTPQVKKSLLLYGLPDISSLSGNRQKDLEMISKEMERLIELFEPRLTNAKITLVEQKSQEKTLHFVIEAQLNVEPTPIPIQLSTDFYTPTLTFI